jgi:zinc transport system substrate-binding protein
MDKGELYVFHRSDLEPQDDAEWKETVRKLQLVDLFIVTENAREEYIEDLLKKADLMYQRPLIYADLGLPPLMSQFEDPYPERMPALPYYGPNTAGQLMYAFVNACMRMDPSNNIEFRRNWQDYTTQLEIMKRRTLEQLPGWREFDVKAATLRGGPEYLVEEAGITIAGVVPPLPEGPVKPESVANIVGALQKINAQMLVTLEPLNDGVRAAIEAGAGVIVVELEPVGLTCEDDRAWDRAIEEDYVRLLNAKEALWQWMNLGKEVSNP